MCVNSCMLGQANIFGKLASASSLLKKMTLKQQRLASVSSFQKAFWPWELSPLPLRGYESCFEGLGSNFRGLCLSKSPGKFFRWFASFFRGLCLSRFQSIFSEALTLKITASIPSGNLHGGMPLAFGSPFDSRTHQTSQRKSFWLVLRGSELLSLTLMCWLTYLAWSTQLLCSFGYNPLSLAHPHITIYSISQSSSVFFTFRNFPIQTKKLICETFGILFLELEVGDIKFAALVLTICNYLQRANLT